MNGSTEGIIPLSIASTGQVVTMTARHLDPGDTYISADNREYRVGGHRRRSSLGRLSWGN